MPEMGDKSRNKL